VSDEALALKKEQAKYYVELNADAITFDVLGLLDVVVISLPGLYDNSIKGDNARRQGAVQFHKRRKVLLIWSGYLTYFTAGVTNVMVNTEKHKVREINNDLSESSYLSELWLV
jgi:hypothetical protein